MSFKKTNDRYEKWLRAQCDVVEGDLEEKHEKMAKSAFRFLRATFFRWAGQVESFSANLQAGKMPEVLAVGDIHCENYGTWRDEEGRLVWGVNDFDEAADIPYAYELVRLATSIWLAEEVTLNNEHVAETLLAGYRKGLARPRPMLPDAQEMKIRRYVACRRKCRKKFWQDVAEYEPATPPPEVEDLLRSTLPADAHVERFATRSAGGGSLGRPRFLVIARWHGGTIVREAKALVPSAWNWAQGKRGAPIRFIDLAAGRYRAPDPFLTVKQRYVVRRLAPDARKIALADIDEPHIKESLIWTMGRDLGAIHAMTEGAAIRIPRHLERLARKDKKWLFHAAEAAQATVAAEYEDWRKDWHAKHQGKAKDKSKDKN